MQLRGPVGPVNGNSRWLFFPDRSFLTDLPDEVCTGNGLAYVPGAGIGYPNWAPQAEKLASLFSHADVRLHQSQHLILQKGSARQQTG